LGLISLRLAEESQEDPGALTHRSRGALFQVKCGAELDARGGFLPGRKSAVGAGERVCPRGSSTAKRRQGRRHAGPCARLSRRLGRRAFGPAFFFELARSVHRPAAATGLVNPMLKRVLPDLVATQASLDGRTPFWERGRNFSALPPASLEHRGSSGERGPDLPALRPAQVRSSLAKAASVAFPVAGWSWSCQPPDV
jgi:hypothetical protein